MREHAHFTYIVASKSRTLYIGITSDLRKRIFEHKLKLREGFTLRYNCNRLVWFENTNDVSVAIQREKELERLASFQEDRPNSSLKPNMGRPERWLVSTFDTRGSRKLYLRKKPVLHSAEESRSVQDDSRCFLEPT